MTNMEFSEGDFVTVRIPKIHRSSTDLQLTNQDSWLKLSNARVTVKRYTNSSVDMDSQKDVIVPAT